MKYLILLGISLLSILLIGCKKEGCTDDLAYNYSSDANKDNGNCKFHYGGRDNGKLSIGSLSNFSEPYAIYFDGDYIGTLSYYFDNADFCHLSNAVSGEVQSGLILVEAIGTQTNDYKYKYVDVDPQECYSSALDYYN